MGGGGIAFPWDGLFWNGGFGPRNPKRRQQSSSSSRGQNINNSSRSSNINVGNNYGAYRFPTKSALTAASLALTGDTIAQLRTRLNDASKSQNKDVLVAKLLHHDWLRALRMTTYGFLLYGPGSQMWYEFLDKALPKHSIKNILLKVVLNQVVLGPCVIAVVFAWNSLWQGQLKELPNKYRRDALPALVYGWKFWTPASLLNFWAVPLEARVAFMSSCSIFWNFYLSTTMVKAQDN